LKTIEGHQVHKVHPKNCRVSSDSPIAYRFEQCALVELPTKLLRRGKLSERPMLMKRANLAAEIRSFRSSPPAHMQQMIRFECGSEVAPGEKEMGEIGFRLRW